MTDARPTWLPFDRYLELIEADAHRLLDVASRDLNAAVPGCPDWTVTDLCRHLAEVYAHKIACMAAGAPPKPWPLPEFQIGEPLQLLARESTAIVEALRSRDPADSTWTWLPADQTVGFWYRRMAQETAVHRVDGEQAVGEQTAIDEALAVDGVDEFLGCMLGGPWWTDGDYSATNATVRVETGSHGWYVRCASAAVEVRYGDADAEVDATIAGEPEQLLLALWGRTPLLELVVDGDPEAAGRFAGRVQLCGD
ncbi:uncharacterized protein (TIGR03083 family) [Microlunatus panaciterrae]|uniref:Uncharacterized protein (TIGR03083 family) n=1 Tax=Microlunatus panaciterrae TaxID=400768 RepID=A0ABS2RHI7_9ACTN|nr:maleylpyruvate isomerase family mycothiol-dependent enzyme [Microlunatus panaciterrae]MBM7798188.1 uncharacterized protein (TIGR03083 family) [Microlunatus panaciterrae]